MEPQQTPEPSSILLQQDLQNNPLWKPLRRRHIGNRTFYYIAVNTHIGIDSEGQPEHAPPNN